MIHDVSTDTDNPPEFIALHPLRLQCKNGVGYSGLRGAQQHQRYPDIVPGLYSQPSARIFEAALAAANALQWTIAAAAQVEGRIEATATTRWMRFKDDVVIRICASDGGTRLDIRSASRIGSSDFGANARRIHLFLQELDNRLKTNS